MNLSPNLKFYSTSAFCFLAYSQIEAQIVYHDIDPDIYLSDYYDWEPIDFDGDGTYDVFFLRSETGTSYTCGTNIERLEYGNMQMVQTPFSLSSYVGGCSTYDPGTTFVVAGNTPKILPAGISIDPSLNWGDGSNLIYFDRQWGVEYGITEPVDNQYLGFRVLRPSDTLYGWFQVSMNGTGRMWVNEYLYSTDPSEVVTGDASDTIPCVPTAPTALEMIPESDYYRLAWEPVQESIGCRVKIARLSTGEVSERYAYRYEAEFLDLPSAAIPKDDYAWNVQCLCQLGPPIVSPVSAMDSFKIDCLPPVSLTHDYFVSGTYERHIFSYTHPGHDFHQYGIYGLRKLGETDYRIYTPPGFLSLLPDSLEPGTTYEWGMQLVCADGLVSDIAYGPNFTTPLLREQTAPVVDLVQNENDILINSPEGLHMVELFAVDGRLISREDFHGTESGVMRIPAPFSGILICKVRTEQGILVERLFHY